MADFQFRPMRTSDHRAVAALWRESAALMGLGEAFLPPVPDLEGRLAADFGEGWSVTLAFEAMEFGKRGLWRARLFGHGVAVEIHPNRKIKGLRQRAPARGHGQLVCRGQHEVHGKRTGG